MGSGREMEREVAPLDAPGCDGMCIDDLDQFWTSEQQQRNLGTCLFELPARRRLCNPVEDTGWLQKTRG